MLTHRLNRLTPEAATVLKDFYLTLRRSDLLNILTGTTNKLLISSLFHRDYRSPDSAPITTRQLESMIRLAEARARSELRQKVLAEDAQDVIELMKFSLWETYTNDRQGQTDAARSSHQGGIHALMILSSL